MPQEQKYQISVNAGPHHRRDCPIRFSLPETLSQGSWQLNDGHGVIHPLQRVSGNEVVMIERDLPPNTARTYAIVPAPESPTLVAAIHEKETGILDLTLQGATVTRYHYLNVPARPYFHPLLTENGIPVTRAYPMQTDVPGETQDHPHHRSLWIAFGEVNGTDNWSEEPGHGFTLHRSLDLCESGPLFGRFTSTSLWTDVNQIPILTQHLTLILWATTGTTRLLDFSIRLEASHGDVHFGDTKEGGILSARVASALDVPRGGCIENVYGGMNEGETWGKAAHWCDYSGSIQGNNVGLAIMDHPLSFRSPTHWHVRNYGLMTANPFGYAAFTNGAKDGSHLLSSGQSLFFHYRLALHTGNATEGLVNAHYIDFALPPSIKIIESR